LSERALRALIVFFGVVNLAIGLVAFFAPGPFYDHIGKYPPENHHYIGDVGAFYIAAGATLLASVRRVSWREPLLLLGAVWYGLHAINHLFDVGEASSDARGIFDTLSLAAAAVAQAYLARVAAAIRPGSRPAS
jgi:Domain of unknown function (DUF4345)